MIIIIFWLHILTWQTNAVMLGTVAGAVQRTVMLLAGTTIKLTFVTSVSNVTLACHSVTCAVSRTFTVTSFTSKAWVTLTEATVWRSLCTIDTRLVTSLAHPPTDTICTTWGIEGGVAYPMSTAVETGTIGNVTSLGHPTRVTRALMDSCVTCAVARTVKFVS